MNEIIFEESVEKNKVRLSLLKHIRLLEKRVEKDEHRLSLLEKIAGITPEGTERIKMTLTLPEAEIGGLYFNEQKVRGTFERHDDGWYHCLDILFLSARNTITNTSRDFLAK
jgi:hypothetical protein